MRHKDWPIRLNQYLVSVQGWEFQIGTRDCCRFISGAVKAMTGNDPMADVPRYRTWKEAHQVAKDETSVYHMMLRRFGSPVNAGHAHQGDIAYIKHGDHDIPSLGIVLGKRTLIFGLEGFMYVRTVEIDRAFRVPFED